MIQDEARTLQGRLELREWRPWAIGGVDTGITRIRWKLDELRSLVKDDIETSVKVVDDELGRWL